MELLQDSGNASERSMSTEPTVCEIPGKGKGHSETPCPQVNAHVLCVIRRFGLYYV